MRRPYQDRLRQLVAGEGEKWELIASYPQTQGRIVLPNSLHVYARRPVASLTIAAPAIRLEQLRALTTRKELRLQSSDFDFPPFLTTSMQPAHFALFWGLP